MVDRSVHGPVGNCSRESSQGQLRWPSIPSPANPASQITGAIRQASQSTGISFQYLLTTAKIESEPQSAGAGGDLVGQGALPVHRPDLARHHEAGGRVARLRPVCRRDHASIPTAATRSTDPAARAAIMKLRSDPETSALMAGAFSRANALQLTGSIGRRPTEGELYIAHFLGARRRRQDDQRRRLAARRQRRARCFRRPPPPTAAFSTTVRAAPAASPRSMQG